MQPESADTRPPLDIPRPLKSPSPKASPIPKQYPLPSPARSEPERQSPETGGIRLHPDEPQTDGGSPPVKIEDQLVEDAIILDGQMDVEMTAEPLVRGEDRSDNQEKELQVKAETPGPTGSPMECQQPLIPSPETVVVPSSEVAVTQPYLPTITRYDAKPRFSAAYESEASVFDRGCADRWLMIRFFLV